MSLFRRQSQGTDDITSSGRSLSRIIILIPLMVALLTILSLSSYLAFTEYNRYRDDIEALKKDFPLQQRHELKFRVMSAMDLIYFVKAHSSIYYSRHISNKLDQSKIILNTGIGINQNEEPVLTPIANDSLDLEFEGSLLKCMITDESGKLIYASDSAQYHSDFPETLINKVVKSESGAGKSEIVFNTVSKEKRIVISEKLSSKKIFIFLSTPAGDTTRLIQEFLLDSISKLRFGNEYIFINTFDGKALITKGKRNISPIDISNTPDSNWKSIFSQELEFAQKPGGDFLIYNWQKSNTSSPSEKISYIAGIDEWKWIIGSGVHTNDIEPIIQERASELKATMFWEMLKFIIFLVFVFVLIFVINRFISNLTNSNIRLFVRFLKNAAISLQPLDESQVHFKEFRTLAKAANSMISDRNRIKSDLETEQSRLRYIIDSIPDLIFIKDTNSLFVGGNRAFEKYIGKKSSEIYGSTEYDLFTKLNADTYIDSDKKLLETLEPVRSNEWITYSDGHKILCDTLKTLYFDSDGKVLGIIGISRDITEMEETRQRLIMAKEKAEESDRLKTAFLANMSHEIRTPMNAIIGFSDLLSDDGLTLEEREDFISKIKISGESLMNIINDIIDIAKIEAGQLKITDSECNVDKLLTDIYGTFFEVKARTNKTQLELILNSPEKEHPLITITDPLRLQQVLTNLLSNALKFTEFGHIKFGYQIEGNHLHFSVEDTGIGILRSKQALLFQRFSQVDTSNTRKYGGTGLGLAISRNIVELMGGTIWLESEPGHGSTFHFKLPLRLPNSQEQSRESNETGFDWKGKKILIAEDIDQNFLLMEAVLRFTQVTLLHAANGQTAIDMAKENPDINLILMDIQLPIKTGYEAIQEILAERPEVPIISFTAFALPREREKSLEVGCVDYLNKPIKPEVLLNVVKKYIL